MAPGTARIAVDLLGGDHAPAVVVGGALRACQADPTLQLLLVGPREVADEIIAALDPFDRRRVRHHADASWTAAPSPNAGPFATGQSSAGQSPAEPSSISAAVRAVVDGVADAVISAGPTGATVTAAALGFGRPGSRSPSSRSPSSGPPSSGPPSSGPPGSRPPGPPRAGAELRRPALAAVLPTATGRLILLDVGASVDPDAETLAGHALFGAAYAAAGFGLSRARVGLLSIGTEDGKGDRVRRTAAQLLDELVLPAGARYVGLVEGHEAVLGQHADVVVTDGFTGNVLLKGVEAAYSLVGKPVRADPPPRAAVLLGVAGTCVVCHGAATAADIASGISLAARLHRDAVVSTVTTLLPDADQSSAATEGAPHNTEESH